MFFAGLKKESFLVWGIAPGAFIVSALWYQFGFSMGGLLEEWDLIFVMNHHTNFWNSFPGNPMSDVFAARPLQILPFFIAHAIDPNSFVGFNLMLMAACFLRIVAGASIGFFLFRGRAYAAALGALFLVFPADTQQMAFRTLNVSCSVALMCCGIALALRAIVAGTSKSRSIAMAGSVALSVIAALIYEPIITLYALPPLLLLARYGMRMTLVVVRQRGRLLLMWVVAPAVNVAYLYYAIAIYKSSYQLDAASSGMAKAVVENLHYLVESGAYRVFYDAWVSAWWVMTERIAHYRFLCAVAAVIVLMLFALGAKSRSKVGAACTFRYVCVGLIAAVAGYSPFMVAASHMVITQRTFMSVAPGASVLLVAIIAWVCGGRAAPAALVAGAAVFLGFLAQLYQFDQYARTYTGIIRPYTSMLADRTDPTKRVRLVRDSTGFGGHLTGIYTSKVEYAFSVRNHDNRGESVLCMDQPLSALTPFSNCALKDGIWTVRAASGVQTYLKTDVQVIDIGKNFDRGYWSTGKGKWRDFESFSASKSVFVNQAEDRYSCTADSMWGYSGFCRGMGWSDGIFNHTGFRHHNFFASIAPSASLIFDLKPARGNYRLSLTAFSGLDGEILKKMKISVNGRPIDYRVASALVIEATVPEGDLITGQNEIRFENVLPAGRDTGMLVSRADLTPISNELGCSHNCRSTRK